MGNKQENFNDKYEEYMENFLCRLLRHDFVVSYINDFFNQNERTYYSFFMLMKVLGAHKNQKFQTNYWSDCYIYFYEKLGIHGILFIPLLLSKGSTDDKKKIIKKYLNEHINNTKERIAPNSNLVINLIEFKKVILTYISCVSTRGLENVIKAIDNDPKEKPILEKQKDEIKTYRLLYSNQLVESFVDVLLRPYSRQNYYINAGKFIDDNIDFLTDDKQIRARLREFSLNQKEISKLLKEINSQNPYENMSTLNEKKSRNENTDIKDPNNIYTDENIKSSRNNLINIIEKNSKGNLREKNGLPLITETDHLNEPLKTIESGLKGILENKKNNVGKESMKNSISSGLINVSFKSGDFDVRNENSIKQIEVKSGNSTKNQIISDTKNNISLSQFEESFREENVPKQI